MAPSAPRNIYHFVTLHKVQTTTVNNSPVYVLPELSDITDAMQSIINVK